MDFNIKIGICRPMYSFAEGDNLTDDKLHG